MYDLQQLLMAVERVVSSETEQHHGRPQCNLKTEQEQKCSSHAHLAAHYAAC